MSNENELPEKKAMLSIFSQCQDQMILSILFSNICFHMSSFPWEAQE